MGLAALGGAGLLIQRAVEPLLQRGYAEVRPRLEKSVGQVLGHPLALGPFRGLGPNGLRIGPSRILAGPEDASSIRVEAIAVRLHPLASWRERSLILDLDLEGAEVDLRRNSRGQFWVLGALKPGAQPPRLELRFRLSSPAQLRLWGLAAGSAPLALDVRGGAVLRTHHQDLRLQAAVSPSGGAGQARVEGQGNWRRNRWQATLTTTDFPTAPFAALLPGQGRLTGSAAGRFALSLDRGRAACEGDLTLRQVRWQPRWAPAPLSSERLPLRCRQQSLELAEAPWGFAGWSGRLSGRTALDRSLALKLSARAPAANPFAATPLRGGLRGRWIAGGIAIAQLDGALGRSRVRLNGSLTRSLDLGGSWRLHPDDLPRPERLPSWLRQASLDGALRLGGSLASPRLAVESTRRDLPLLGPSAVSLLWSDGVLQLRELRSDHLQASASLPLSLRGGGLRWGDLTSRVSLRDFPLSRLSPLLGTRLTGTLDAEGSVKGPLSAPVPDLALLLRRPGAGPLRLLESWQGRLAGPEGDRRLNLTALEPAAPGQISARLDRRWMPVAVRLERGGGELRLTGQPQRYLWSARGFPLTGLALALGADPRLRSLRGTLAGQGDLSLQPLAFQGLVTLDQPELLGLAARRVRADVAYGDRRYRLQAELESRLAGSLQATVTGRWAGPFEARIQARHLGPALIRDALAAWGAWQGRPLPPRGRAADLGDVAIETLGLSLDAQLAELLEARRLAAERDRQRAQASRAERFERLQFSVDADLRLAGPSLNRARADLRGRGHLWMDRLDQARQISGQPFAFRLEGPLRSGEGDFELAGVPLALLSLLTTVPESLRGGLSARGRYRIGAERPGFEAQLALDGAGIGPQDLALERGSLSLAGRSLQLALSLRAAGAFSSVDLAGTVPLDPDRPDLELRLASRDDGLLFLTRLAGDAISWKRGNADVQLLVRGSLREPIANGFLRLRNGECSIAGQTLRALQATLLFDSERLVLQEFAALVGRGGSLRGQGQLGLIRPLSGDGGLAVDVKAVPFAAERIRAQAQGRLLVGGSLLSPLLGGELAIANGSINVTPAPVARAKAASYQAAKPTSVPQLMESKWDFREPLVLLGPDVASPAALDLEESIPQLPWLRFSNLRLTLGPELRVVMPNVANFTTGGSLRINGSLDPSLRASGVVKLLGGRLSLFTTSFSLDPETPNVAIFTPSLGLIPYLDIALRTRISDSLNVLSPSGVAGAGGGSIALNGLEAQNGFSSLSQLKLIRVTVSVSGPADRLAENLRIRSNPPLPQERLLALIGGNSLAGLSGGQAGTALATVLGQSLLSPLLSTLSDALGERVSLALYPTYVTPAIDSEQELRSGRVPPQLVLGAEVGYDLTERINASLLMAPNRSDIPPQFTLNYKASEQLNLEASVDSQGSWLTQLRVFLRF